MIYDIHCSIHEKMSIIIFHVKLSQYIFLNNYTSLRISLNFNWINNKKSNWDKFYQFLEITETKQLI